MPRSADFRSLLRAGLCLTLGHRLLPNFDKLSLSNKRIGDDTKAAARQSTISRAPKITVTALKTKNKF